MPYAGSDEPCEAVGGDGGGEQAPSPLLDLLELNRNLTLAEDADEVDAEVAAETEAGATRGSSSRLSTGGRVPASDKSREATGGGGDGEYRFMLPGLSLTMAELEAVSSEELREAAKMFARAVQLPGDTDSRARIVGALNVIQRTIQRRKAVEAESEDEVAPPPPHLVGPGRYCPPRHRLPFDSRHEVSGTTRVR